MEQLANGKWRVRITVRGKRKTIGQFDTEKKARRMLKPHHAEVEAGNIEIPGAITLKELGAEWLDQRELHGSRTRTRVRSIDGERSVWRSHVLKSELANMAVQSIRASDVERFVLWLRTHEAVKVTRTKAKGRIETPRGYPISQGMQREALRLVRGTLNEAVRRDLVPTNVAKVARVARGGRVKNLEDQWLRADEIDQLLSCEKISMFRRTVYACAIGLALRLEDLKSLKVSDVHLDAEVPGPHVTVWISKSEKHHRVPIMPWLQPWLRAHLETLPKGTKWLFGQKDGLRYCKGYDFFWAKKPAARSARVSALTIAGVDRKIRFHDLRGTCATHLALGTWGRTWSLHEIQRMLTHSDQRVTERYVRRALDTLSIAARETKGGPGISVHFGPSLAQPSVPMSANAATATVENLRENQENSGCWTRTSDKSVNSRSLYQLS